MKLAKIIAAVAVVAMSPTVAQADSSTMKMPTAKMPTSSNIATAAKMGGTLMNESIPTAILNTPLIDSTGKSFTLASLKGKSIVLSDFFTSCADICPLTTANMRDIGNALTAAKLSSKAVVIEVTVDPEKDTPSRLALYKSLYGGSDWMSATGNLKDITALWKWFGVYIEKTKIDGVTKDWQTGKPLTYDITHADVVNIIGPDQKWKWIDLGNPAVSNPTTMPAKMKAYLSASGLLNLTKPQDPSWTTAAVYGAFNQLYGYNIGTMKMKM
jgi:protein SCO1/2